MVHNVLKALFSPFFAISAARYTYMFAYIEVGVATMCFIILLPCVVVLFTTSTLHINCKVILGTSALAQEVMLASQISMFGYDIYIGNVMPDSEDADKPFLLVHEATYIYTTFLSLMIVLERYVATYNPASYEIQTFNYPWVVVTAIIGLILSSIASYSIHIYYMYTVMIPVMLFMEMMICLLSITLLFYCKRQLRNLPYDSRRLRAKYQLDEVFSFTRAVLPAILISSLLKLLALGPPTIWRAGLIDFPTNQVLFFPMHACTCVVMKCCLIFMHKGMMRTMRSVLPKLTHRISVSISPVQPVVDKEKETDTYFENMKTAWK